MIPMRSFARPNMRLKLRGYLLEGAGLMKSRPKPGADGVERHGLGLRRISLGVLTTLTRLLPNGSTRGVELTLIPLIGVLAVLRLPTAERRIPIDLLVGLLAALVVWQAISVEINAGTSSLLHVIPGGALLMLAVVGGPVTEMSLADIRFALVGVLPALCCFLTLGWIAQYAHLVPPIPITM